VLRRPDETRLAQELEARMRASVARSLSAERGLGSSGAITAKLLLLYRGDWQHVEYLMRLMARQGRLEAGHG
jgi:hypothetical protein